MAKVISVIIPVYNGESYIARCIESVLGQQGIDPDLIEILVLNDGSSDRSAIIGKEYADKYPKIIKYVEQHNMGVAKTRNKGISLATGEYVMFIDQDDYIDSDCISNLYAAIVQEHADVVLSGLRRPNVNGRVTFSFMPKGKKFDKYLLVSAWAKLHRKKFLTENQITFFTGKLGEDLPFTIHENMKTKKIAYIPYIGYNWFNNNESVSNTVQRGLQTGFSDSLMSLLERLKDEYDNRTVEVDERLFRYFMIYTIVGYLGVSGRTAKPEDFIDVFNSGFAWIEDSLSKKYIDKYLLFGPAGAPFKGYVGVLLMVFLRKTGLLKVFANKYCKG